MTFTVTVRVTRRPSPSSSRTATWYAPGAVPAGTVTVTCSGTVAGTSSDSTRICCRAGPVVTGPWADTSSTPVALPGPVSTASAVSATLPPGVTSAVAGETPSAARRCGTGVPSVAGGASPGPVPHADGVPPGVKAMSRPARRSAVVT